MPRTYVPKTGRRNGHIKPVEAPVKYVPGFIRNLDRRTEVARRLRARFDGLLEELGGEEQLGGMKLSLLERFVWMEKTIEKLEAAMRAADDPRLIADISGRSTQAVNALQGLAKMLGLETATGSLPWSISNGDLEEK